MLREFLYAVLAWMGVGIISALSLPLFLDPLATDFAAIGSSIGILSLIVVAPLAF